MALLDWVVIVWMLGWGIGIAYQAWVFTDAAHYLKNFTSVMFLILQMVKISIVMSLWPALIVVTVIQLMFVKGAVDEFNDLVEQYNRSEWGD